MLLSFGDLRGAQPPFPFGAMTQKHFNDTVELIRFYQVTGRVLTTAILHWSTISKDFGEQWKSLTEHQKKAQAEDPTLTKDLGIL